MPFSPVFAASALHRFVFFPNKLNIRSTAELKAGCAAAAGSASSAQLDTKANKVQTLEMVMFRLVTFMASVVSLPFKTFSSQPANAVSIYCVIVTTDFHMYGKISDYDCSIYRIKLQLKSKTILKETPSLRFTKGTQPQLTTVLLSVNKLRQERLLI